MKTQKTPSVESLPPQRPQSNSQYFRVKSLQLMGLKVQEVTAESLMASGNKNLNISGLPDSLLKENKEKLLAVCNKFNIWGTRQKALVHLHPSELHKSGTHLELPIALAILGSQLDRDPSSLAQEFIKDYFFVGNLALNGKIMPTDSSNTIESMYPDTTIGPSRFSSLKELWNFILSGDLTKNPLPAKKILKMKSSGQQVFENHSTEILQPHGRYWERFWLAIAATAKLPVLMMGPPGVGKSYLASWAHQLIPACSSTQKNTIDQIWQLAGLVPPANLPHIRPHSRTALSDYMGTLKGAFARPGLFSLAHSGLLVLDEFAEMNRDCREILRIIIEQKHFIRHSSKGSYYWPADFWLILTLNPCPCGHAKGKDIRFCRCLEQQRRNYINKLSGPILDRMGVRIFLDNIKISAIDIKPYFEAAALDQTPPQLKKMIHDAQQKLQGNSVNEVKELIIKHFPYDNQRQQQNNCQLLLAMSALNSKSINHNLDALHLLKSLEKGIFTS